MIDSINEHAPWLRLLEKIPVTWLNFILFTIAWVFIWLGVEYLTTLDGEFTDRFNIFFQISTAIVYSLCFFFYPYFFSQCQNDFSDLSRWDKDSLDVSRINFGLAGSLIEISLVLVLSLFVVSVLGPPLVGYSFLELFDSANSLTDKLSGYILYGSYLIISILLNFGLLLIVRFCWLMAQIAGRVNVVLLRVRELVLFSNMFLRVLGIVAIFAGLLLFNFTLQGLDYDLALLLNAIIALPILVITFIPCARIASRINKAKSIELARIGKLIEEQLINASEEPASNKDLAEVLAYEQRVQDVWEWPFETQIKKIFFFVLLPPVFWLVGVFGETLFESFL